MASSQQDFGRLPDFAPLAEGRVSVVSKCKMVRSERSCYRSQIQQPTLFAVQADGGWLAVYKFTKQNAAGHISENLRHYAMWQGENGSCVFKVYETWVELCWYAAAFCELCDMKRVCALQTSTSRCSDSRAFLHFIASKIAAAL